MTQEQIENNNKIFTSILVVQEVSQRLLSELIGCDAVSKEVKQTFNTYLRHGERFRNKWLKAIEVNYGEKGAEMHETDADYNYELFKIISKFRTDQQFEMAKAVLSNILNSEKTNKMFG